MERAASRVTDEEEAGRLVHHCQPRRAAAASPGQRWFPPGAEAHGEKNEGGWR